MDAGPLCNDAILDMLGRLAEAEVQTMDNIKRPEGNVIRQHEEEIDMDHLPTDMHHLPTDTSHIAVHEEDDEEDDEANEGTIPTTELTSLHCGKDALLVGCSLYDVQAE